MSQQSLEDEPSDIHIKRPFLTKTLRQLDRHQLDHNKKMRRKERRNSTNKSQQMTSNCMTPSQSEDKILSRLPVVTRNGNRIIAEWKNDQIQGQAQIFYQNGVYFKGQYQNGIKINGHFKFKSGFQYKGNCFGNTFSGKGTLIFPSGKTIEGQWKHFEVIGNGKISYPKGEVYYGEIKDFKKHGKGYFYFSDGSRQEGEFLDGVITGKGSYFVEGKLVSTGKWVNGELQEEETVDIQKLNVQQMMKRTVSRKEENGSSFKDRCDKKTIMPTSKPISKKVLGESKDIRKVHFN